MNKALRILAVFMALILSLIPASAFAVDGAVDQPAGGCNHGSYSYESAGQGLHMIKCTLCGEIVDRGECKEGREAIENYVSANCMHGESYSKVTRCTVCNQIMASESVTGQTLGGHEYSDKWSFDDDTHWHACVCGEKKDIEAHKYGEDGKCLDCGKVYEGDEPPVIFIPVDDPLLDIVVKPDESSAFVDLESAIELVNGISTAEVTRDVVNRLVDAAVAEKSASIVIDTFSGIDCNVSAVKIKSDSLMAIAEKTDSALVLSSDSGVVTLSQQYLDSMNLVVGQDVTVSINKVLVDETVEVSTGITVDGAAQKGTVKTGIMLPNDFRGKSVVCVTDGSRVKTAKGSASDYTFDAKLSSKYTLMLESDLNAKAVSKAKKASKSASAVKSGSKVKIKVSNTKTVAELKKLGYKITYKYYSSTDGKSYKAIKSSSNSSILWSGAKKRSRYYYKYKMVVKTPAGKTLYTSSLSSCKRVSLTI